MPSNRLRDCVIDQYKNLFVGLGIDFIAGERAVAAGDNPDDFRRRFSVRVILSAFVPYLIALLMMALPTAIVTVTT
jgi:hypothetical protein